MAKPSLIPESLLRKSDLAKLLQVSTRQIEHMVNRGRLPKPLYLGNSSPRWRHSDIDGWLQRLANEANQ